MGSHGVVGSERRSSVRGGGCGVRVAAGEGWVLGAGVGGCPWGRRGGGVGVRWAEVEVGGDVIDPSERCVFVLGGIMLWASEEGAEPGEQRRFAVTSREELQAVADEILQKVAVFVACSIEAECF